MGAVLGKRAQDPESRALIVDALMRSMPLTEDARGVVDRILEGATRNLGAIGLVGAIGLIWSASGMLGSLRGAVETAWEGIQGTRPFVRGKLIDAIGLVLIVVFVLTALIAGVVLSVLVAIAGDVPSLPEPFDGIVEALRSVLATVVTLTVTVLLLFGAYKLLPSPRPPVVFAVIGALVATGLLEVARRLLGYYIANVAVYDVVYGSIGSVIAFLFFIYIAAAVVLFGAEVGSATRAAWTLRRPERPSPP